MNKDLRTTDIVLTCSLLCHGHKLDRVAMSGRRGTFYITDIPDELLDKFDNQMLMVEPKAFHTHLRDLSIRLRRVEESI